MYRDGSDGGVGGSQLVLYAQGLLIVLREAASPPPNIPRNLTASLTVNFSE